MVDGMFLDGSSWRHVGWDGAGAELARAIGDLGEEVLAPTAVPGDIGQSDLWELLEHGELRTIWARLEFGTELFDVLPMDGDMTKYLTMRLLRPYVTATVIATIGHDVEWSVDWSGTAGVRAPGYDIDRMVDDLFAGGPAAVAVRTRLVGDRSG